MDLAGYKRSKTEGLVDERVLYNTLECVIEDFRVK